MGRCVLWAGASYGAGASNGTVRHVGRSVLWAEASYGVGASYGPGNTVHYGRSLKYLLGNLLRSTAMGKRRQQKLKFQENKFMCKMSHGDSRVNKAPTEMTWNKWQSCCCVVLQKFLEHNWDIPPVAEYTVYILEGAISGKRAVGRPRPKYLKQVARNTAADSHTAINRVPCNNCRWKAANQSKEWRIRRWYTFLPLCTDISINP